MRLSLIITLMKTENKEEKGEQMIVRTNSHGRALKRLTSTAMWVAMLGVGIGQEAETGTETPSGANELARGQAKLLDETIVTASRLKETLRESPYTASVLDRRLLEDRQTRSLPDAFRDVPGVLIQKTAHGHGSPYIRGFTGRQNLLLVDGVRVNNSSWRSGPVQYWNTFDIEAVDRLELVKGQGSVLFGSDSIGGTLNVSNRGSGYQLEDGKFWNGETRYRFDTNSQSHVGRFETRVGEGDKWGLHLGVSLKEFGDIRDSGVGRMRNTGYPEQAFDLKFEAALNEDLTMTLAHQYINQDDVWRWHNTIFNPGWSRDGKVATAGSDLARIYDQERSLTYLRLDGESKSEWLDRWNAIVSFQTQRDGQLRDRTNTGRPRTVQSAEIDTYGLVLTGESTVGPGVLVYGLDYYRDELSSNGLRNGVFDPSLRPVADDASYDLFGVFGQYRWQASKALELDFGARYSHARAEWEGYRPAGAVQDLPGDGSWDDLSLSLRGKWKLTDEWSMYGGVSQAFRAPNISDLTGSVFSLSGLNTSGSPDLTPEHYINYELGSRWSSQSLSFNLAGYYTQIEDQIVNVNDGLGGLAATNAGEGYVYGVEAEAAWNFHPDFQLRVLGAWQDGKIDTPQVLGGAIGRDTIRRMHPLMGRLALRWTHPGRRFWIEGLVDAAATMDNLAQADANDTQRIPIGGTPGYVVVSLNAVYQMQENLEMRVALENLTDQDYRFHGSGQNEVGTNAVFGLTYRW